MKRRQLPGKLQPQKKLVFKLAIGYLFLLFLLLLVLPWLPLPYSPNDLHLDQIYLPPFQYQAQPFHFLGTDALGRDVFVNTLYGARTAFNISLPVTVITTLIGIVTGIAGGYFGNNTLQLKRAHAIAALLTILAVAYWGLYLPIKILFIVKSSYNLVAGSFICLCVILFLVWLIGLPLLKKIKQLAVPVSLPIDLVLLRLIETFNSIPKLMFILVLASFLPTTIPILALILILTYWTGTARFARAETLKIKNLPYIEAATSIGASRKRILAKHALPNMLGPLVVAFTFELAGLLAFESTLSFLGIGVPPTLASWGRMISGIRQNTSAWWLIAFPGSFLVLTVLALQTCSYYLLNIIQSRKSL